MNNRHLRMRQEMQRIDALFKPKPGAEPDVVVEGLTTELPEVQRDEARAVARELLARCLALIRSDDDALWAFGGVDPEASWIERYPWLTEPEARIKR